MARTKQKNDDTSATRGFEAKLDRAITANLKNLGYRRMAPFLLNDKPVSFNKRRAY